MQKYEKPFLFGCSYYLMQDSFFTTSWYRVAFLPISSYN
ncbi:hypothetical protein FM130_01240 [Enterococcus faecium]|nr:hypothetical protein FM130_01240 [Enterococcus faecium]